MTPPEDPTFENDNVKEIIMAIKKLNARMPQKHDIENNWNKAINFIPLAGEIIVYDPDTAHSYARLKCGDGVTTVVNLPFIIEEQINAIILNVLSTPV